MEKPRVAVRSGRYARLLMLSALLGLAPALLAPQQAAPGLILGVSVEPEQVRAGGELTVTLIVDFPDPLSVRLELGALSPGLSMDRLRSGTRMLGDRTVTVIDCQFIVPQLGRIEIGESAVQTTSGREVWGPLSINVLDARTEAAVEPFSLRWELGAGPARAGRPSELRLVGYGERPAGKPVVRFSVPANALLEQRPTGPADEARGVLALFVLTPLSASRLRLENVRVVFPSGEEFQAPVRELRPLPAGAASSVPTAARRSSAGTELDPDSSVGLVPFPYPAYIPALGQSQLREVLDSSARLWAGQDHAGALGLLRRAERVSGSGAFLAEVRREAERALGLGVGFDEPRQLCYLPAAAGVLFLICVALLASQALARSRTGRAQFLRTIGNPASLPLLALISALLALAGLGIWGMAWMDAAGIGGRGRLALVADCVLYPVPDEGSTPLGAVRDATSVRVPAEAQDWACIETADGRAGWVPASVLRNY